jgi:3-oxoacyl-[acyl-carrier-protein] synthase II
MRKVAITGIGLVTPLGIGVEATWRALVAGESGAGPITLFDTTLHRTKFGCEVKQFDPVALGVDKREAKSLDRFIHFAIVGARLAMEDAGFPGKLEGELADRAGCYIGVGLGGTALIERTLTAATEKGPRHGYSPFFVPGIIVNMAPGLAAMKHNLRGPNMAHVSACATGAHSIGEAARLIERGECDLMVAGGCEAAITAMGVGGFNAATALSTRNDDPKAASRPFDADRDGFVIGEGAGVLVLEPLELAQKRGARVYGLVAGYGATCDAHHMTAPVESHEGLQRAMKAAAADAKLPLDAVQYVNAHGTSTKFNDLNETRAIKQVFGPHAHKLAVSSTKSMTGHLLGGAGGIEAAFSALAIHHGVIPPTINYTTPDPECDLDYVPNTARQAKVDVVMSNSSGFGGTNAVLVVTRA